MPRPRLINPKRNVHLRISEDLFARILSELYSSVEGCVPYSKQSEFVEMCIREYFQRKDIAKTTLNDPSLMEAD